MMSCDSKLTRYASKKSLHVGDFVYLGRRTPTLRRGFAVHQVRYPVSIRGNLC